MTTNTVIVERWLGFKMAVEARRVAHWRRLERRDFRNEVVYPPLGRRRRQLGGRSMTNLAVIVSLRFVVRSMNWKREGSTPNLERARRFQ